MDWIGSALDVTERRVREAVLNLAVIVAHELLVDIAIQAVRLTSDRSYLAVSDEWYGLRANER
jgi:hypothetical protein